MPSTLSILFSLPSNRIIPLILKPALYKLTWILICYAGSNQNLYLVNENTQANKPAISSLDVNHIKKTTQMENNNNSNLLINNHIFLVNKCTSQGLNSSIKQYFGCLHPDVNLTQIFLNTMFVNRKKTVPTSIDLLDK